MKKISIATTFLTAIILSLYVNSFAQKTVNQPANPVKSTTYKTEKIDFGAGGTVTIVGAPNGSIAVEGWQKSEIQVEAEIEISAENQADLAQIAAVTDFLFDEGFGHTRIISVGMHDREFMKRKAKKFPKRLLGNFYGINYKIKVPNYCDLEINGGKGDFMIENVEGAMFIKFLESNAKLNLTGGAIDASFGSGKVEVNVLKPSWRGRMLNVNLASGNLEIFFPPNLNAQLDAIVLRNGNIENNFPALKPRERTKFTEKIISAKAGSGGAAFNFKVGDGILKISTK